MISEYILIILVYILNDASTATIPFKREQPCKINVVLFFASAYELPKEAVGMEALKMHEVAKVKYSIPGEHSIESPSEEVMHSPPCKELLKEGMTSLIHFSQNVLGMRTAVVSVSKAEITNDISNSEIDIPPEFRERHFSSNKLRSVDRSYNKPLVFQQPLPAASMAKLRNVITSPEHTEVFKIRVKRQFPEKESHNEIVNVPLEKENTKHPWDVLDIMSHIRYSFFGKLFENGAKNKLSEEGNQIAEDLTKTVEDPGLFETVKTTLSTLQDHSEGPFLMTIFGGHLCEVSSLKSALVLSIKHVIENTDPKNTLIVLTSSCPEAKEEHAHNHHVEAGEEISPSERVEHRPISEHEHIRCHEHDVGAHEHRGDHGLGQKQERSIKFGHPYGRHRKRQEEPLDDVVHIGEGAHLEHQENASIPIFARGPEYTKLAQCSLLFDVPVVVKSILEQFALAFDSNKS